MATNSYRMTGMVVYDRTEGSVCGVRGGVQVNELAVYVLFQEGRFDMKLRALHLVTAPPGPTALTKPVLPAHPSATFEDAKAYIRQAINSGAPVFNKVRLCMRE